jgi:hypothetical protein
MVQPAILFIYEDVSGINLKSSTVQHAALALMHRFMRTYSTCFDVSSLSHIAASLGSFVDPSQLGQLQDEAKLSRHVQGLSWHISVD